ncbi:MAG: TetR/AcrR family transcriptional regulator, partial [Deltaproteobacteria bacterium]
VFSKKGFNKATMEDIAKESELSPGTLYLYFKNKEELYASLSLRILYFQNIRVEQVIREKDTDPETKLRHLMDAMFDVYEFDPLVIINMFHLQSSETLKNLSTELLLEIKAVNHQVLNNVASIFQDGIDQGLFVQEHPVALADIFLSTFGGVVLWEASKRAIDPQKDFLKSTLRLAFEVFANGIKK